MARLSGKASNIKAGNYQFTSGMTPYQIFEMMSDGDVTQAGVTFIEGWTFRQMREALNSAEGIAHVSMELTDAQIMERIGASESYPEGLFFPDTYYFVQGMSDIDILQRAYQAMQAKLASRMGQESRGFAISERLSSLNYGLYYRERDGQGFRAPAGGKSVPEPVENRHAPANRPDGDLWLGREV